jgi:8-oxo-dGTP pyrophosphatase MutT (NUDIX family)
MKEFPSNTFKEKLSTCFNYQLPGLDAHLMIAHEQRIKDLMDSQKQGNARKSSVLLLFYEKNELPHLVFIKRPVYNGVHSGQIAFPGGKWEIDDTSLYNTALREPSEEIGILPEKVNYIGKLTDLYIPPSNYLVSPYVGYYSGVPIFNPDPKEVYSILEISLNEILILADPFPKVNITILDGTNFETYGFEFKGNIIWGATAMILNEFLILWKTTVKIR